MSSIVSPNITPHMRIGLLGARSLVGRRIIAQQATDKFELIAFSRQNIDGDQHQIKWRKIDQNTSRSIRNATSADDISTWISVVPIWAIPQYFDFFKAHNARRIVALSSTSRFTKISSSSSKERNTAEKLEKGEKLFSEWAERNNIEWIIFRPTLIYGYRQDKNIFEISRIIRKFGFFPLPAPAKGLRQPIHADDIATACIRVCNRDLLLKNEAFNLSGGETLSYEEMVIRIFKAKKLNPKIIHIPSLWFRVVFRLLHHFPRYKNLSFEVIERMNTDLVFDHNKATAKFGFKPRQFFPSPSDVEP